MRAVLLALCTTISRGEQNNANEKTRGRNAAPPLLPPYSALKSVPIEAMLLKLNVIQSRQWHNSQLNLCFDCSRPSGDFCCAAAGCCCWWFAIFAIICGLRRWCGVAHQLFAESPDRVLCFH